MESTLHTDKRFFSAAPKTYLHIAVVLLLEICLRWAPPFGQVTQEGMAVMGVFLGTIYGWLTIGNMGLVSLIGMLMMGTTMLFPGGPTASVLAALGHPNTMQILTCFGVAGIMNASGTSSYLAKKIVGMKIGRKSPLVFVFLFMVASLIIGPFVSFATAILLWNMWKEVCETLGAPKSYLRFGITCIAIAVNVSFQCFPFVPMMVTLNGVWTGSTGLPPAPFLNFVCYMLLMATVMCILWVIIGKKALKIEMIDSSEVNIKTDRATSYQKYVICGVVAYVAMLCLASMNLGAISTYLSGWGLLGFSTLFVVVTLCIQPQGAQKSFHEIMSKSVSWDLVATMGMVMLLAASLGLDSVGFGATLASSLGFVSTLGPIPVLLIMLLIPTLCTQFMSNLAIAVIFIPICYMISSELGLNVYAVNCSLYMLNSVGMGSPAGSLGSAMYYAHDDIDKKTGYMSGWIFTILSYIVAVIFFFVLGDVFFPMGNQ